LYVQWLRVCIVRDNAQHTLTFARDFPRDFFAVYVNVLRRIYAKTNFVAANFDYHDFDHPVGNQNTFTDFPR
jgi:hypothetical protein